MEMEEDMVMMKDGKVMVRKNGEIMPMMNGEAMSMDGKMARTDDKMKGM